MQGRGGGENQSDMYQNWGSFPVVNLTHLLKILFIDSGKHMVIMGTVDKLFSPMLRGN